MNINLKLCLKLFIIIEYQEIIKTMINQSQKDLNKNKKQIQWKQECEELIKKLNNEVIIAFNN